MAHDTTGRLGGIRVPTLVVAGGVDIITPPRLGRVVADSIPGAEFVLLPDEAHQPFQEVPEQFNALVDEFWCKVQKSAPQPTGVSHDRCGDVRAVRLQGPGAAAG